MNDDICNVQDDHKLTCSKIDHSKCAQALKEIEKNGKGNLDQCGFERVFQKEEIDLKRDSLISREKLWFGKNKLALTSKETMDLDGLFASGEKIELNSSKLRLSGFVLAFSESTITCKQCDYSGAEFFGISEWTVNGKICPVKNNRLTCDSSDSKQ